MKTWPTPSIWLSWRARMVSVTSLSSVPGIRLELTLRISTGLSAGLTLRQVGRLGRSAGRRPAAVLMAAWTSCAAVSMLLLRVNCSVRLVEPSALLEVIWVMPGIALNCTSSGVATEDAMVSGLAPGSCAVTWMVGNSASGNGAIGNRGNAITPSRTNAKVNNKVATGWSMHHADTEPRPFIVQAPLARWRHPQQAQ